MEYGIAQNDGVEYSDARALSAQDIFQQLELPVVSSPTADERIEWVLVTPDVAKRLLGINYENQRNVQPARVDMYARDMANGNWNPQSSNSIRISSDGKVIDGQHRLLAVIKSGASILMRVDAGGGSASTLFDYIDNTMARTAGQFIKAKNANAVAALSKSILCLENGSTLASALKGTYRYYKENGKTVSMSPTRYEVVEYARENTQVLEWAVAQAKRVNRSVGANPLTIGLAIWCIREIHDAYRLVEYISDFVEISPMNRTIGFIQGSMLRKISQAKQQRVTVDKSWTFGVFAYGYDSFVSGITVKTTSPWEKTFRLYSAAIQAKYQKNGEVSDAD